MAFLGVRDAAVTPQKHLKEYACTDADATRRCYKALKERLHAGGLTSYFRDPMMKLSRYLLQSSIRGMRIDRAEVERVRGALQDIMDRIVSDVQDYAGREINVQAPRQKAWLIFEKIGIPTTWHTDEGVQEVPRTPGGDWCVDRNVLEELYIRFRHPVLKQLQDYSRCQKLKTTYVDPGMVKWIDIDGRVHPTFKVGGAVTGRVTTAEPPVGTIPRDRDYPDLGGRPLTVHLRDMFISNPGWEITYADISQAELTVAAILAQCERMLQVFREGRDIHNEIAWAVLGVPRNRTPDKQERTLSKNIVFGRLIYGGSSAGVAAAAGCDASVVDKAYSNFAAEFPELPSFLEAVEELALTEGQLTSPFGRVRRFPNVDRNDKKQVGEVRREARNYYEQNGAAEVCFRAFVRICERFKKYKMQAWPINMVYDSIITEHPIKEGKAVQEIVTEEMTRPVVQLDGHRFKIAIGQEPNWGEAERNAEEYFPEAA